MMDHPIIRHEILDILKKHKVKATFFVVGKETEHAKKMYQRIVFRRSYIRQCIPTVIIMIRFMRSVGAFSKDLDETTEIFI